MIHLNHCINIGFMEFVVNWTNVFSLSYFSLFCFTLHGSSVRSNLLHWYGLCNFNNLQPKKLPNGFSCYCTNHGHDIRYTLN